MIWNTNQIDPLSYLWYFKDLEQMNEMHHRGRLKVAFWDSELSAKSAHVLPSKAES